MKNSNFYFVLLSLTIISSGCKDNDAKDAGSKDRYIEPVLTINQQRKIDLEGITFKNFPKSFSYLDTFRNEFYYSWAWSESNYQSEPVKEHLNALYNIAKHAFDKDSLIETVTVKTFQLDRGSRSKRGDEKEIDRLYHEISRDAFNKLDKIEFTVRASYRLLERIADTSFISHMDSIRYWVLVKR